MPGFHRFNVTVAQGRTSISLDETVAELLALHLGHRPGTAEAQAATRHWLQAELDAQRAEIDGGVSQWLRARAVQAVARPDLKAAHERWKRKRG